MRREVVVPMGAAALITLMMIGLCGEVAAQTVMPGETGVDLTDARGQTGMNDAARMWPGDEPTPEPSGEIVWEPKGQNLVLTVVGCGGSIQVSLRVTLEDTGDVWDFSGRDGHWVKNDAVKFTIRKAPSGTYHAVAVLSFPDGPSPGGPEPWGPSDNYVTIWSTYTLE